MAILLSTATGKTAETNKATLQRLAADKGHAIKFLPVMGSGVRYDTVMLNGKTVGLLFDSHEATIAYLTRKVSRARPMAMAAANPRKLTTKARRHKGVAKRNPGGFSPRKVFFTMKYKSNLGPRTGSVQPDGKAFIWEIRDPSGKLTDSSATSAAAYGGNYYTKASAIRALKKAADNDSA